MASEVKKEVALEIAHVLFIDIVGYSKGLINEQRALLDALNRIVRETDEFQSAEQAGRIRYHSCRVTVRKPQQEAVCRCYCA